MGEGEGEDENEGEGEASRWLEAQDDEGSCFHWNDITGEIVAPSLSGQGQGNGLSGSPPGSGGTKKLQPWPEVACGEEEDEGDEEGEEEGDQLLGCAPAVVLTVDASASMPARG